MTGGVLNDIIQPGRLLSEAHASQASAVTASTNLNEMGFNGIGSRRSSPMLRRKPDARVL